MRQLEKNNWEILVDFSQVNFPIAHYINQQICFIYFCLFRIALTKI